MVGNSQSGNVLFYILLAVALLAALSMAMSRGNRTGIGMISDEQTKLAAQEIIDYGNTVAAAVQKLRMRGCRDIDINFSGNNGVSKSTNGTAWNYTNGNSPADGSCHVFHLNGGAITPKLISAGYIDPSLVAPTSLHSQSFFVNSNRVLGLGTESGSAGSELMFWIGRLDKTVCMKINDILGISNPNDNPPYDTASCLGTPFTGSYTTCANPMGDTVADLKGKTAFCNQAYNSPTDYIYYQVLIVR